ncbi:hypothetical protein TeGR_g1936 [Tetraparma gracilis]|uniref:protein-tyrosine-phosphatase n=1 Tax=Tetraparma gracilis TaxID=2962635 RepID=A0ABQ6N5D5_9STRA|nr:hypothetical protein TeGR_g1936 [Tetraparma gracilis]
MGSILSLASNPGVDKRNAAYLERVKEHRKQKQLVTDDTKERAERKLKRFKGRRPTQVPSEPTLIATRLYLGNMYDALDPAVRTRYGDPKFMVNCTTVPYNLDGILVRQMNIEDNEEEDIGAHLPSQTSFIESSLASGTVLVHCEHGVSRSATVVIAFLMKERHITAIEALRHVRELRPLVCPNEAFLEALCDWERLCGIEGKSTLDQLKSVFAT